MKQPTKHRRDRPRAKNNNSQGAATTLLLSKTRVCIKNLPPANFSEHDLRAFLLQQLPQAQITDCRILKQPQHVGNNNKKKTEKSRRVAFCGFGQASQAKLCVERLHMSYCRTARLVVEYAHLPAIRHENNSNDDDDNKNNQNKRKSENDIGEKSSTNDALQQTTPGSVSDKIERKKQEFLAVMGVGDVSTATSAATSKRKFWANDEDEQHNRLQTEQPKMRVSQNQIDAASSTVDEGDSDSSDNDDDSVDDADPLQSSRMDDMDFLRSKQVVANDLDDEIKDEAELDQHIDDNDETSSSTSSSSRGSDHDKGEEKKSSFHEHQIAHSEESEGRETTAKDIADSQEASRSDEADNRLFLRNLPFSAQEEEIRNCFSAFGTIIECHIPADDQGRSKGFGFVTFAKAADAQAALSELDGTDFQGRLLHILPARPSKQIISTVGDSSGLSFKERMEHERIASAMSDTRGWSASFVRGDAVVDNLASRLGLNKGDIMAVKDGLSAGDAAVRLALGETAVIEENRKYFAEHGVDMEALVSGSDKKSQGIKRSNTQILVKNLPHDTTKEDLLKVVGASGGREPKSILLPPSRTIAVIEYGHGNDAKVAFRRLAYRRFKSVPLYLEWAPLSANKQPTESVKTEDAATEREDETAEDELTVVATSTLYVKNLNFQTTEEQLEKLFSQHVKDVRSVRIPKKAAPMKRTRDVAQTNAEEQLLLSMGYGFVELGSSESARKALKLLNGTLLDGHILDIKPSGSNQGKQTAASDSKKPNCKLMVRNVPFQANRKELLQLFGSFGQLKKVRLPKKFDGTNRGFAFVEYLTGKEAAAAMQSLSRTHLYGRHLVIEWAATDEESERLDGLRVKAGRDITAAPKNKKIRFDY